MENIIVVTFAVESEAYQAFSELKANTYNDSYVISQAALARNSGGRIEALDWFNVGAVTNSDAILGGVLGALIGIVGGPIGMLLGGSYGALVGSTVDLLDADQNTTMMEHVMACANDGKTVLIAMVQEEEPAAFNANFAKYQSEVVRFDAAEIAVEVEEAQALEEELARKAREQARQDKKESIQEKITDQKAKLQAEFRDLRADVKELREL